MSGMVTKCGVSGEIPSESTAANKISLFAWIFFLLVLLATYCRLYFGINFADETLYIAIPFRFILGDVPFRDDITSPISMFWLVSYPFFKIFYQLNKSTDGIVLFARHLFFAMQLLVAAGVYKIISNFVRRSEALLIASCALAFIPFNIPAVSYNTLSAGFLTLGLMTGAWGIYANRSSYLVASGFILALCVAGYPPLILVGMLTLLYLLFFKPKTLLPLLAGSLIAVVMLLPLLKHLDLNSLQDSLRAVGSFGQQGGGLKKLAMMFIDSLSRLWLGLVVILVVYQLLVIKKPDKIPFLFILLPLILALTNKFPSGSGGVKHHGFMLALALVAPWLFLRIPEEKRRFLLFVWVPSAVAGIVTGYSSNNGYLNAGIGFAAGGLISITALVLYLGTLLKDSPLPAARLRFFVIALTAGVLVYYQYAAVYWDKKIYNLSALITSGPYKHLRTTPEKAQFLNQIEQDVTQLKNPGRIVFYYDFPAGYLLSARRPASNALWLFSPRDYPGVNTAFLERDYFKLSKLPDVIVRFNFMILPNDCYRPVSHVSDHPIDRLLATGGYQVVVSRRDYVVYRKV